MIRKIFIISSIYIILPFALWWLRYHEKRTLRMGRKLNEEELNWAKQIGIIYPNKIRVLNIARIPTPIPQYIENFLQRRGYPAGNAAGMCMYYGIYVKEKYSHKKLLLAHELVHTHQFERLGGHWQFLKLYLRETMILGYTNSPLEKEANTTAATIST